MRVRLSTAVAVVFAMLQIVLVAADAQSQRLPSSIEYVQPQIQITATDAIARFQRSSAVADLTTARSSYDLPVDTMNKGLGRRMLPYAIGGALVGGVIGYAVMPKSCDVGDNMACHYTSLGYPFIGVGVGAWAGILVGYLRER